MDRLISMRGGRALEVREYGDPGGHPVVFFHGLIGSHHQAAYVDGPARREGLRVVAWNRPGVGRSGFAGARRLLDAVPDIEDLADALGLGALPWSKGPRVVVLDNASIHTGKVARQARRGLAASGIYLYFLPPYSPDLNRIESLFRQVKVKYQEMPQRSFTTRPGLREAVDSGFDNYGRKLRPKHRNELRPAA